MACIEDEKLRSFGLSVGIIVATSFEGMLSFTAFLRLSGVYLVGASERGNIPSGNLLVNLN